MRDVDYRRKSHAHKSVKDYDRKSEREIIDKEIENVISLSGSTYFCKHPLPEGYTFTPTTEEVDSVIWGMITLPEGYEEKCMYVRGLGYHWEE